MRLPLILGVCTALLVGAAQADVLNMGGTRDLVTGTWTGLASLEMVPAGDPGNAPDTRYNGVSVGAVAYTYAIGKYDITAGQYTAFLNAVAVTDIYGLYSPSMDYSPGYYGCNIKRSGAPGNYAYSVAPDWANRPVNFVSWGDAARFANWMNNGQPSGPQNLSTTEDGAYYLNGATGAALMAVTRKPGATWFLPSEDEWYKAAHYDPNRPGGAGYWNYATRSDNLPSNVFSTTGTNNASFYWDGFTIGGPYYRTEVGALAGSRGPYGTFDQNGNVSQWNDSNVSGGRGVRGGSFYSAPGRIDDLVAYFRIGYGPTEENYSIGFRVAAIPLLGDANLDGTVDINDLTVVLTNYDKTGLQWADGDFDGNGTVTVADQNKVLTNYNKSIGGTTRVWAIPEPSTIALLLAGSLGLLAHAWRNGADLQGFFLQRRYSPADGGGG